MPKIIDIEAPENDKFLEFSAAIASNRDKWLSEILNKIDDLDIIFKSSLKFETPLTSAVRFDNENAVRILCNRMKSSGILTRHLSHEAHENTPLHFATYIGNPEIVKILLSQGADPNAFSGKKTGDGDTPLMSAIRYLSTHSLIYDGDWGDKELQEKLKLWYAGKVRLPSDELTVKWSGKLNIISLLLENGADPSAKDKFNVSPWSLVTTFNDPAHYNRDTFSDGTSRPTLISGDSDHAIFRGQISSRSGKQMLPVKIIYDIREVRKLLAAYKDKNKDTCVTSQKVRELSEAFTDEVAERKAKVEDLSRELKRAKDEQKPLIQEYKSKAERSKIIEGFSAITGTRVFFEMFTKKLHSEISVIGSILTDKVNRAHYTTADKAADGVAMLSDIPLVGAMVGGAPKVFGAGIQMASDHKEKGKHKHLQKNVPLPSQWAEFCEDIAIAVLKQSSPYVSLLDATRSAKLSEKAVGIAFEALSKNEINGNVQKFLVDTLVGSDVLAKMLKKLCEDQAKANAKHPTATVTSFPQHQYAAHKQKAVGAGVGASVGQSAAAKDKCVVM